MSSNSVDEPVSNRYTPSRHIVSISFRLPRWVGQCRIPHRLGFGTVRVNSTVVLKNIGLAWLQGQVRRLPGLRGVCGPARFTSLCPARATHLDWTAGQRLG